MPQPPKNLTVLDQAYLARPCLLKAFAVMSPQPPALFIYDEQGYRVNLVPLL